MIDGRTLLGWGLPPGPHMKDALTAARAVLARDGIEAARLAALAFMPMPKLGLRTDAPAPLSVLLSPTGPAEERNLALVLQDMERLMQVPTVLRGAVMPDACPAGPIAVGGVVETENAIHPGLHSADICCSVMATVFADADPTTVLEAGVAVTHFGGGGRRYPADLPMPRAIGTAFAETPLLADLGDEAAAHFATQGDGNHFLFVGRRRSDGRTTLVTHHGSRRPGAMLYKRGMALAEAQTKARAAGIPRGAAWLEATSPEGQDYWEALQVIRAWTKASHEAIHAMTARRAGARVADWLWNEHNFVFERTPGRFLHGKGATPAWGEHHADADRAGRVLIPLNMAEPILIARGLDNPAAAGFAPHGAGRNFSRSQYMRDHGAAHGAAELSRLRDRGLDVRFWFDAPDASELPSAYKDASAIRAQIESFGLATIVDLIDPTGCVMAGTWVRRTE